MAKTSYTIPKRHPEKEVKVRLNLDVAMTDVLILFSLSKYATKMSLSNLNKLLDVIDMESYCINYDIYNRLVVIKHILDGRLNKDLSNMTLIRKEVEADPLVEELCTIITWTDDGLTIPDVNRIQIWVDERMKYWFFEAMMPKLIDKWNRMAKTGFNTSAQDIEEMNDMMRDVVSTMQTSSLSSGLLRQFKFSDPHMEDIIRGIVEISQHPTSVLKTGMKAMNNVLGGGGFRGGKLYLFLGPSGKFKSGTLLNMADQIRNFNDQIPAFDENGRRNTILFVTMENDIALTLERVFGMYAPQVMDFTEASPDEVIDTIKNKGRFVYTDTTGIDIDIRFFGNLEISTRDLFDIIEDMKKDGSNCICLILDYLKRIESSHDCMGDEIKRAMYASNELHNLAEHFNIPVITAQQINRGGNMVLDEAERQGKTGRGTLIGNADIGGSWAVVENADWVCTINREYEVETAQDFISFNCTKVRAGGRSLGQNQNNSRTNEFQCKSFYHPFVDGNPLRFKTDVGTDGCVSLASITTDLTIEKAKEIEKFRQQSRVERPEIRISSVTPDDVLNSLNEQPRDRSDEIAKYVA